MYANQLLVMRVLKCSLHLIPSMSPQSGQPLPARSPVLMLLPNVQRAHVPLSALSSSFLFALSPAPWQLLGVVVQITVRTALQAACCCHAHYIHITLQQVSLFPVGKYCCSASIWLWKQLVAFSVYSNCMRTFLRPYDETSAIAVTCTLEAYSSTKIGLRSSLNDITSKKTGYWSCLFPGVFLLPLKNLCLLQNL